VLLPSRVEVEGEGEREGERKYILVNATCKCYIHSCMQKIILLQLVGVDMQKRMRLSTRTLVLGFFPKSSFIRCDSYLGLYT